ncbi:MAG TPA: leucyl/phenylalanyl-tRNA--protein transferase [Polyangiaceae bacterium]|nr:leucyl/phenylalanyl-tRNA--protein transferase [Polyangiaceae bacterium]
MTTLDLLHTPAGEERRTLGAKLTRWSGQPVTPELLTRKARSAVRKALYFTQHEYHRALGHAAAIVPEGAVGGLCGINARLPFTPEQILLGYAQGLFPVDRGGRIHWHCPDPRCVLPLAELHVPSRIRTYLRGGLFELCFDRAPEAVLRACGARKSTWLTERMQEAYLALFRLGAMHTVEAWQGERLVGGAFGVALGTVFTVESMFSNENHASKLAFAHLCLQLQGRGFEWIDCQYQQDHFRRFGAIELPRAEYRRRLALGLIRPASFPASRPALRALPAEQSGRTNGHTSPAPLSAPGRLRKPDRNGALPPVSSPGG